MKKQGILNAELSAAIARLGHTDGLVICDAGLPIPAGPMRIDVSLLPGVPSFLDVLRTTLTEMRVERALIATEFSVANPKLHHSTLGLLHEFSVTQQQPITIEQCPHEEFKRRTTQTRAIVRSGECTPYANVILYSGVAFRAAD